MVSATNSENQGTPQQVELTRVETFATMFRREYPGLVALAWTLTGSRAAAEDIAQDAMVELYRRWDDVGSIINLHSYLRRMCVNLSASSFRRRAMEARALLRLAAQPTNVESLPENPKPPGLRSGSFPGGRPRHNSLGRRRAHLARQQHSDCRERVGKSSEAQRLQRAEGDPGSVFAIEVCPVAANP
jgi:DNA-directed RNA polymerase specialized sigma24 family protein